MDSSKKRAQKIARVQPKQQDTSRGRSLNMRGFLNSVVRGKVRKGDQRGRQLGYPTANMNLHQDIPDGVYISTTKIGSREYRSMTFIGAAKTFGKKKRRIETTILDFKRNLYGQWIHVTLLRRLRGNKKFSSVESLITAIQSDEKKTRLFFEKYTK